MTLPRRKFLKSGVLSAISAGVVFGSARAVLAQKTKNASATIVTDAAASMPMEAQLDPVFRFTRATFDSYVGDIFQAPDARGQMVSLTLVRVESYKPQRGTRIATAPSRFTDCFSLSFRASSELPPFTSIHTVSHPALGSFDLYLTPQRSADGISYEAVINHVH
jgi:hypothetical protein